MKMACADPPYIGQAKRWYGNHPDYAGEVDHEKLIERLMDEFRDGWALSCSSPTLRQILNLCPPDVRIGAWTQTDAALSGQSSIAYSWEPVVFLHGRHWSDRGRTPLLRDTITCARLQTKTFRGWKPPAFCWWLFDCLGLEPEDDFHDLFPGSGAVWRAWESYRQGWVPRAADAIQARLDEI